MGNLKDILQADLKTSMIGRDSFRTEVIKSLKSAILYAEVADGKREAGLSDDEILAVFKKESKKRQDSIDLYKQGGNAEQAQKEQQEKDIIDSYLPPQLSEEAVNSMIDSALAELAITEPTRQDMGRIMGSVKSKAGAELDSSILAKLVQSRISS